MKNAFEGPILLANPTLYAHLQPRFANDEHFECGDGWATLIAAPSHKLEAVASTTIPATFRAVQVKPKLGSLRVYVRGNFSEEVRESLDAARQESVCIRETCGSAGRLHEHRSSGWIRTLCVSCAEADGFDPRPAQPDRQGEDHARCD